MNIQSPRTQGLKHWITSLHLLDVTTNAHRLHLVEKLQQHLDHHVVDAVGFLNGTIQGLATSER